MSHIYENFYTLALEQSIDADKVKPLIMDINKKYGLQVFEVLPLKQFKSYYHNGNNALSPNVYFLTSPHNGFMYGAVWAEVVGDDTDTEIRYNFFSRTFKKSRGWDYISSRTLSSIKMSTLMRSIAKHKAISDVKPYLSTPLLPKSDLSELSRIVQYTVKGSDDVHRMQRVPNGLSTNAMMSLLETYLGIKNRIDIHPQHNKDIVDIYDNLKKANSIEQEIKTKKKDVLNREMYAIIADDKIRGFAIGKVRIDFNSQDVYTITEPFVRYADLDQYKEIDKLRPILTMFKVHTEDDAQGGRLGDLILKVSKYYEDLDILNLSTQHHYNGQENHYLFIPTGGV
jgi:hypothetical protein